jgi:hypothetical protein
MLNGRSLTKLKRKSLNQYFVERCDGGPKSKDVWPTIKPFLSNKGCNTSKDTILTENANLITNQKQACEIFGDGPLVRRPICPTTH